MRQLHARAKVNAHPRTTLCRDGEGEGRGVTGTAVRSPSIMVRTLSGISVASVHWSCQLLSFAIRMSLACAAAKKCFSPSPWQRDRSGHPRLRKYRGAAAVCNRSEALGVNSTPPHPQKEGIGGRCAPCRGRRPSGRRTCSVCLPGNRSASSPPAEPLCSRQQGTAACPSDGSPTFPGTDSKTRQNTRPPSANRSSRRRNQSHTRF